MCYNTFTYKSPPQVKMTAGGFEPPRQLSANSFQSYRACQLHHAVSLQGEGSGYFSSLAPRISLSDILADSLFSRFDPSSK